MCELKSLPQQSLTLSSFVVVSINVFINSSETNMPSGKLISMVIDQFHCTILALTAILKQKSGAIVGAEAISINKTKVSALKLTL